MKGNGQSCAAVPDRLAWSLASCQLAWQQRRVIFADDEEHLHFLKQLGPVYGPPSDDKLFSEYCQLQSQSDPSLPGCSNRSEFTN